MIRFSNLFLAEWDLLQFSGQDIPKDASPGALIAKTTLALMEPF